MARRDPQPGPAVLKSLSDLDRHLVPRNLIATWSQVSARLWPDADRHLASKCWPRLIVPVASKPGTSLIVLLILAIGRRVPLSLC